MNVIRTFVIQKVFYWYSVFLYLCITKVKINYNYLLNNIVVSHTSIRYNHGIYELYMNIWINYIFIIIYEFDAFELLRTSLLIAYLLRDLWDAIFVCYLSVQRYNSVSSIAYPVVFQCRCLCHMACVDLIHLIHGSTMYIDLIIN